mmetsp:Transcript_12412/g.31218  ORF Transcript_12412/g.31218 Transcript_12412/m.31218 type:complete len:433 (+) Transcript_12412:54-1352(+)
MVAARRAWLLAAAGYNLAALVASGSETFRVLPASCDGCFSEPLEVDYFGAGVGSEPPRASWSSLEDGGRSAFEEAARLGKVLIIENASSGTALAGWTCEQLAKEFPDGRMRREYDWVANPDDRNLQTMGSQKWIEAQVAGEEAKNRVKLDSKAPPFAPFYWGVREHRGGQVGSKKVVKRIQQLIASSVPKFMDQGNSASMFDNAEFWLGANGTGARAHMDSHCISTLSVVLSGERRWRVGPVPRMPKGAGRSKDGDVFFDDGVAYTLGWKPMFEFTVRAGEAVLFPPGWIHETLNIDETCTVALTTQFDLPRPVRYWRNYYGRLRRIGDLGPCWKEMRSYGSLGALKQKLPADVSSLRAHAEQLFENRIGNFSEQERDFYDVDADGSVGKNEFVDTFVAWAATEHAINNEKATRKLKPDMRLGAPGTHSQEL